MLIDIAYDMIFEMSAPTPMLLLLYTHPSRSADLDHPERIETDPPIAVEDFTDPFGNRAARILAPIGQLRLRSSNRVRDVGQPDPVNPAARQHPVQELPPQVLPYLFGSRYCEVDRLTDIAWQLFGHTPPGWPRVQAVCDWVHQNVKFGYPYARPTKTAWDVYYERTGVCRDFMHLAVTLCRCLGIPARYVTGYLGDIGVPPEPTPMDFSAWFEAYLDGRWWTFDARHNMPRIGRVLMATGRDAVDVALTTSFGKTTLKKFSVVTELVPTPSVPSPGTPGEG